MLDTKVILDILPQNLRLAVQSIKNFNQLQEIRLKVNEAIILRLGEEVIVNSCIVTPEDIKCILQRISNYSIYSISEELKQGYITIKGGHRVGLCGNCVIEKNKVKTMKDIASINIRVCREIIGCSDKVISYIIEKNEILNTIIISPPKCGKTTLLRDITRILSQGNEVLGYTGRRVCVVDERSEIGACYAGVPQLKVGFRTDILDNCPKSEGIMMAIRSMAPDIIACDEIGTNEEVESILMALNSGVRLITTIHGFGIEDLFRRVVFKDILENRVFQRAIVLSNSRGIGTIEYIYDFTKEDKIWRP